MKKYFSCLFAALLAMMMIASCGKEKKEEAPVVTEVAPVKEAEPVKETRNWDCASVLFSQPGVYVVDEANSGKLRWVGSLTRGMEVYVSVKNGEIEKLPMNFANDKEGAKPTDMAMFKFEKFGSDNEVYYIAESNIELGTTAVVVGDDIERGTNYTFIYKEPDIEKLTSIKVPAGTLIVVQPGSGSNEFCKCTFYIASGETKGFYRDKYLELRAIETSPRFLLTAMAADRFNNTKDLKPEVAAAAFRDYSAQISKLGSSSDDRGYQFDNFVVELQMLEK